MFTLVGTVFLLLIADGHCAMTASVVLYQDGTMNNRGTITFTQNDANSLVVVSGTLTGLNVSSAHGFHVHVSPVSDGNPNCTAAGAHFNPYNVSHGPRLTTLLGRHVGDLGNLTTDATGTVVVSFSDGIIQLYNATQNITGRTLIVHNLFDDGGMAGNTGSMTTGNAGARLLCGLIKLSTDSHGLCIQPTVSLLLLSILLVAMMFKQ